MTKNLPAKTFKQNREKLLNGEILNESIIPDVDDDQIQRENVKKHISCNNIKFLSVCDNIDCGQIKQVRNRNLGKNMGT